jgi:hypothetical protein
MPRLPDVACRGGLLLLAMAVAAAPVPTAGVSWSIHDLGWSVPLSWTCYSHRRVACDSDHR